MVLLQVRQAEVPDAAAGAVHAARNQRVLFCSQVQVAPVRPGLAHDGLGEVVERSRRRRRSVYPQTLVRESGSHLVPVRDIPMRLGPEDRLQLVHRQALCPIVFRAYHHRQRVEGHGKLDNLYAVVGAGLKLGVLGRTGGVPHLYLAGAHRAPAGACAGGRHVYAHALVGDAELFSHGLADGEYRARAGDRYIAGKLCRRGLRGLRSRRRRIVAAAAGQRERQKRNSQRPYQGGQRKACFPLPYRSRCQSDTSYCGVPSHPGISPAENRATHARVTYRRQRAVNARLT